MEIVPRSRYRRRPFSKGGFDGGTIRPQPRPTGPTHCRTTCCNQSIMLQCPAISQRGRKPADGICLAFNNNSCQLRRKAGRRAASTRTGLSGPSRAPVLRSTIHGLRRSRSPVTLNECGVCAPVLTVRCPSNPRVMWRSYFSNGESMHVGHRKACLVAALGDW